MAEGVRCVSNRIYRAIPRGIVRWPDNCPTFVCFVTLRGSRIASFCHESEKFSWEEQRIVLSQANKTCVRGEVETLRWGDYGLVDLFGLQWSVRIGNRERSVGGCPWRANTRHRLHCLAEKERQRGVLRRNNGQQVKTCGHDCLRARWRCRIRYRLIMRLLQLLMTKGASCCRGE